MDLQELKEKWNVLDERLSTSEVYNKRVLQELVRGRVRTGYQRMLQGGVWNLAVTFVIVAVLVPLLYLQGVYGQVATVWTLEAVGGLGILMAAWRLTVLARFDAVAPPERQLQNLVSYKRCRYYEMVVGVPLAVLGIAVALLLENNAVPVLGYVFITLGVSVGAVCGWQRHRGMMREIGQSLAELKEFE